MVIGETRVFATLHEALRAVLDDVPGVHPFTSPDGAGSDRIA